MEKLERVIIWFNSTRHRNTLFGGRVELVRRRGGSSGPDVRTLHRTSHKSQSGPLRLWLCGYVVIASTCPCP